MTMSEDITVNTIPRRLLRSGAWLIAGRSIIAGSGLATSILLARLLPAEELGVYFLLIGLATIFAVVGQLGIGQAVVKNIAAAVGQDDAGAVSQAVYAALCIGPVGAAVAATLSVLVASALVSESLGLAVVVPLWLWSFSLSLAAVCAEIFRGWHDIRLATWLAGGQAGGAIGSSMLALVLVFALVGETRFDLATVMAIGATVSSANLVLALILIRLSKMLKAWRLDWTYVSEFLRVSLPIWIENSAYLAMRQLDIVVMAQFRPAAEVAVYGIATRLAAIVLLSSTVMGGLIPSTLAELHSQNRLDELERIVGATAAVFFVPLLVVCSIFVIFGHDIISVLFGDDYGFAYGPLVILMLGPAIASFVGPAQLALNLTGRHRAMMAITLLSGAVTVIALLGLVPTWGAVGAAIAGTVGLSLQSLAAWAVFWRGNGISTHARLGALRLRSLHRLLVRTPGEEQR